MPASRVSRAMDATFRRPFRLLGGAYLRYAEPRHRLRGPGRALTDETGAVLGYIDYVEIAGAAFRAVGWSHVAEVALTGGAGTAQAMQRLARPDVGLAEDGTGLRVGFELAVPHDGRDAFLCLQTQREDLATRHVFELRPPAEREIRRLRRRVALAFCGALLAAVPSLAAWMVVRTPESRRRVIARLGIGQPAPVRLLDAAALLSAPRRDTAPAAMSATIVLPVYNAFELLQEALDRVERHTDVDWRLILVEDCSSDPRVRPYLRAWAAEPGRARRVELLENDANRGFIGSVNRAFARALEIGHHVVLLNSDALVPAGWASRLLAPIAVDPAVASVTPMSNDAEILSVPGICRRRMLEPGQADALDRDAARLHPALTAASLPTGVGFCMAMNLAFLRRVGPFDESFGSGYGEEVDWCQRARAAGGRHVGLGALFVEHRGGSSFGSEAKLRLVRQNNRRIAERYPGYDAEVQAFVRDDPLATARLALALSLAGQAHLPPERGPVPVYLAHSLGGGAELYLQERLGSELAAGGFAVVLRTGHPQARWHLELHWAGGRLDALSHDFGTVRRLLEPLVRRHIVYSCGVGHHDGAELPHLLLGLRRQPGDTIEVLFHDYFPLSPSYTLLGRDGRYRGVPLDDTGDIAHSAEASDGRRVGLAEWRAAWAPLLAAAADIVVFSRDSREKVLAVWPDLAPRISVRPHRLRGRVDRLPAPARGRPAVIGVLGNINHQKGGQVVEALGRAIAAGGLEARIVLLGRIAPEFCLPSTVHVHGPYDIAQLGALTRRYGITGWLIPSVWPETFSYTTHEALATGRPVWCFDLGAQAEALRAAPNGRVLASRPDETEALLAELLQPAKALRDAV